MKVTDCTKKERFIICFRWVDTHEDFTGIYNVGIIKAVTLATFIKDVLIRFSISLSNARGQCYNSAKNLCVIKKMFLIKFCQEIQSIFHTLFWAFFKFGCCRYGEECAGFERQYGHNLENFQSY